MSTRLRHNIGPNIPISIYPDGIIAGKTAGLGLALLLAANAYALGLGEVAGRATLGQPLHLEIPVLGSDGAVPASSCFRLRAPLTEVGNDFAARNARVQAVGDRGGVKLVVTTSAPVREPVVGFAVVATCGGELAKDYVLLAGLPAETPVAEKPAPALPIMAPPAKPALTEAPAVGAMAEDLLRVDAAVSLEALARQKYPNQPKAREKFMRMMLQANPGLAAEGPIAAGSQLRVPPGLPVRRIGPYLGETKGAPPAQAPAMAQEGQLPAAPPPMAQAEAPKPKARAVNPAKDRLVLGAAPPMSEAKLLEEAERLAAILVEQNKTQDAMTENLAKLEASYGELKKEFTQLQQRLARVEAERLAEKQAATMSVNFVELLMAVLAGGALGGLALHFYLRLHARRQTAAETAPLEAAPIAARNVPLPWSKTTAAAPAVATASAAAAATAATAATAVVIEAAEAAPIMAAAPRPPTPIDAALAAMAAVDTEPPPPAELLPAAEPAPAAPVAPPTAEPVAVETAAALPDDLDSLSLDFPLVPETPPESPPLELPALAAADAPPEPIAEPPAPEMLTLDFPEIPKASSAEQQDDHVIDFEPAAKNDVLDFSKR